MAPLSLHFLSYDIGLGIVKGARGIVGWMGVGENVQDTTHENRVKTSDNQM